MNREAQRRKKWIRWALAAVLAVDLVLLVIHWRPTESPQAQKRDEDHLEVERKLLAADVDRAWSIRRRLPDIQREADEFFAKELREASTGYSAIVADLGGVAQQAGLQTDSITFKQRDVPNRGVIEVEVAAVVDGSYPSLITFINGLERSSNFYVLDSLSLASSAGGNLKLNLQLRTYFRS